MGIPGLSRLIKNINNSKVVLNKSKKKVDHLLIDFNGIVYNIFPTIKHKYEKMTKSNFEKELISETIKYLKWIICTEVKPQKTTYIAIDGPVPRGKIHEQRSRRYKSLLDKQYRNEIKKDLGLPISKENGILLLIWLEQYLLKNLH